MKKLLIGCLLLVSTTVAAQLPISAIDVLTLIFQGVRFSMTESTPREINVVSKGTGKTQEQAVDSALNSAVQKAIGVLVVSDQTVSNGKVIRDLTAQYSSGVVNEYKINRCEGISPGSVTCEISAKVSPWKFMRRLEGNPQTTKVNGNDLAAQATTSRNALIQREKMTRYYMSQIRQSGLDVVIKQMKIVPSTSETATLFIEYEVKWNQEFKKDIIRYLQKLEKDTSGEPNQQVYIQWAPTGINENRVRINTYDEKFRSMMHYYMFQPVMVKFNELNICEDIGIDYDVFAIDWYGVKRQKTITINPDKLRNLQSISMSLGCT